MIVIKKNRVLTITICLVLTFVMAGITRKKDTVETVALPVEDKVIILDARSWVSGCTVHQVMKE